MAQNAYYDEIMALQGLNDFKDVIEQWQRLSDNLEKFHAKSGVVLPNMLWSCATGFDRERLLDLLTNYMYEAGNLMEFYGTTRRLDYFMDYVPAAKECHEIEKITEKIRDAAGFRSEYHGVITIDVSEWVGHFKDPHFLDFLKYLVSLNEDVLYVFTIPSYNPQAVTADTAAGTLLPYPADRDVPAKQRRAGQLHQEGDLRLRSESGSGG